MHPEPAAPQPLPVPPGMAALINSVLGVPFTIGGRAPASGLDCLGLVLYLLREGLGLELEEQDGDVLLGTSLTCLWRTAPGREEDMAWCQLVHPWDVLCWVEEDVQPLMALRGHVSESPWYHCALAVNPEVLLSASLTAGVGYDHTSQITHEHWGRRALALFRPVGIGPWEPIKRKGGML